MFIFSNNFPNDDVKAFLEKEEDYFPLSINYVRKDSSIYLSSNARWYFFSDTPEANTLPLAVICLMGDRYYSHSVHISVFECRSDKLNQGLGTQILNFFLNNLNQNFCKKVTLQIRSADLENFYSKLGFYKSSSPSLDNLYECDLSTRNTENISTNYTGEIE